MNQAKSDRYTESLYIGGLDQAGLPYIGRVFWSYMLAVSEIMTGYQSNAHITNSSRKLQHMYMHLTWPQGGVSFPASRLTSIRRRTGLSVMLIAFFIF